MASPSRRAGSSHPGPQTDARASPSRSHSSASGSPSEYASAPASVHGGGGGGSVLSPEPDTSDIELDMDSGSLVSGGSGVGGEDDEELYSDGSSSLEIPNESIDFDVVYSLRHFVATIEGQASVSKGDAMILMDDSNSYWWLVKVLRSEDIGYIPAENIETPIERLARLNKHRNVDLASATQAEREAHPALAALSARRALQAHQSQSSRRGTPTTNSNSGSASARPKVIFSSNFVIHNYPPAVWDAPLGEEGEDMDGEPEGGMDEDEDEMEGEGEGEDGQWDEDAPVGEDALAGADRSELRREMHVDADGMSAHANAMSMAMALDMDPDMDLDMLEPDDGISWAGDALKAGSPGTQRLVRGPTPPGSTHALAPGNGQPSPQQKASQRSQLGVGLASTLRPGAAAGSDAANGNTSRERLLSDPSPAASMFSVSAESGVVDPAYALSQQQLPQQQVQFQQAQQQQQQFQPGSTASRVAAATRQIPGSTMGLGIAAPAVSADRPSGAPSTGPSKPSAILQAQQAEQAAREQRAAEREARVRQGSSASAASVGAGSLVRTASDGSGSAPSSISRRGGAGTAVGNGVGMDGSPALSVVSESDATVSVSGAVTGGKRTRGQEGGPRKLRKQTSEDFREREREKGEKEREGGEAGKKKGGLLSGLPFWRGGKDKDKGKEKERERVERERAEREKEERERQREREHTRTKSDDSQESFVSPAPASVTPTGGQQQSASPPSSASKSQAQRVHETSPATPSLVSLSSAATSAAVSPAPSTQASRSVQQLDKEQQERYAQYLASTAAAAVAAATAAAGGMGTKSQSVQRGLTASGSEADFATQSAAAVAQNGAAARIQYAQQLAASPQQQKPSRPGSLILTSAFLPDAVPQELSVLRVFAGEEISDLSEATFKTVLLGPNTTSRELIRQAVQRFRLPEDDTDPSPLDRQGAGDEPQGEYYLTVKQAEGGAEAVLMPDEKPLAVFEELSAAGPQPPSVSKRASFGSINSMASNLSSLSAIARLQMSDFTDDSRVKFYLNRRRRERDVERERLPPTLSGKGLTMDGSLVRDDSGIMTASSSGLVSDDLHANMLESSFSFSSSSTIGPPTSTGAKRLSSDRFSASSARFALQTVIHPSDLPDGMLFDPHTEAIVPRSALAHRSGTASASASPGVSQTERKKVFIFARNTTVAEVIETSLDRFGIAEGVVDGGDDVEDRVMKRRSMARVRYGLSVEVEGEERMLHPSSKIIDAFPRQPAFKIVDLRRSADAKRRSMDEPSILGSLDDIQPDDPVFVLRRAGGGGGVRTSGSSRHSRHSVPLDDVALARLHAERRASASMLSMSSDRASNMTDPDNAALSRQEIIREQRAQSRARQHGLLTAQTSDQGVDLVLPDRSRLRSTKGSANTRTRYSYIQPDGETYDISDIIEDELGASNSENETIRLSAAMDIGSLSGTEDLLEEVLATASLGRDPRSGVEQRLERVLHRVKENRLSRVSLGLPQPGTAKRFSAGSAHSGSFYSEDAQRSPRLDTSFTQQQPPQQPQQQVQKQQPPASPPSPTIPSSPVLSSGSGRSSPPSPKPAGPRHPHQAHARQQPSIASVLSDLSMYDAGSSAPGSGSPRSPGSLSSPTMPSTTTPTTSSATSSGSGGARKPMVIKSDFAGISRMMALIQLRADMDRPQTTKKREEGEAEKRMFGPTVKLEELHPSARELFEPHFKQMEEYDQRLDRLFMSTVHAH